MPLLPCRNIQILCFFLCVARLDILSLLMSIIRTPQQSFRTQVSFSSMMIRKSVLGFLLSSLTATQTVRVLLNPSTSYFGSFARFLEHHQGLSRKQTSIDRAKETVRSLRSRFQSSQETVQGIQDYPTWSSRNALQPVAIQTLGIIRSLVHALDVLTRTTPNPAARLVKARTPLSKVSIVHAKF